MVTHHLSDLIPEMDRVVLMDHGRDYRGWFEAQVLVGCEVIAPLPPTIGVVRAQRLLQPLVSRPPCHFTVIQVTNSVQMRSTPRRYLADFHRTSFGRSIALYRVDLCGMMPRVPFP